MQAHVSAGDNHGKDVVAECRLIGARQLTGSSELQPTTHFTGRVRLSQTAPSAAVTRKLKASSDLLADAGGIYQIYFHGPAYRVIERAGVKEDQAVGLFALDLPPNASPSDGISLMAPRLIELCFQTAGVWKIAVQQQMALPLSIEWIATYRQSEAAPGRLYARVTTIDGAVFDAQVIDEAGEVYVDLKGYRTVTLPGEVSFG